MREATNAIQGAAASGDRSGPWRPAFCIMLPGHGSQPVLASTACARVRHERVVLKVPNLQEPSSGGSCGRVQEPCEPEDSTAQHSTVQVR